MGKTSPTQRAIAWAKKNGYEAAVVEQRLPIPDMFVTRDMFNFADLVVLRPGKPNLAVQVTSGPNLAARVKKILAEPRARMWLEGGGEIEAHGWRRLKVKRGGKAVRWELRVVPVTLADFADTA